MGTARAVPATVLQKWPKLGKCAPPPGTTKMSLVGSDFRGWEARTRLLRRQTVRESWGESSHMRVGGATEAIWDGSARHFRETECKYRRCRNPLMYRPASTRGGVPPPPPSNLAPGATFGAATVPRGLTSRELPVPSKGCRPQKKIYSDHMETARAMPAIVPQKWPKLGKCPPPPPPRNHQNVPC